MTTTCNEILLFNNLEDLKCPITMLYFRDPVTASDGHLYERDAINNWIKMKGNSPLTREPLNSQVNSCHIVKKMVDQLEKYSTDPFFYVQRYQQNLCQWTKDYVKKYNIPLDPWQHNIINDIPDIFSEMKSSSYTSKNVHKVCKSEKCSVYGNDNQNADCTYESIFGWLNLCQELNNHELDINTCRSPYRKKIYEYMMRCDRIDKKMMTKKIIESTSPHDEGLIPFLEMNSHSFEFLTPEIHFKLFNRRILFQYINFMNNIDQFNNFINHWSHEIVESSQKYILECFVSNCNLYLDCCDIECEIAKLFEKYVVNPLNLQWEISNVIANLCEAEYVAFEQYSDNGIKIIYKMIFKLVKLGVFDFSNIYDIMGLMNKLHKAHKKQTADHFEQILCNMIEEINVSKMDNSNINDLFDNLGSDCYYINIKIFEKWFLQDSRFFCAAYNRYINEVSINLISQKKSLILPNLYYLMDLSTKIIMDCEVNIKTDIEIEIDSQTYADLVALIPHDIDFVRYLYNYLTGIGMGSDPDIDIIKCAIIQFVDLSLIDDIFEDIMNTVDMQKVHEIGKNEYSVVESLLNNQIMTSDILGSIVQKLCQVEIKHNVLIKIISSQWITQWILVLLPINLNITCDLLKCASTNPMVTKEMLTYLIHRMN